MPTEAGCFHIREIRFMEPVVTAQVSPQQEAQEALRRHRGRIKAVAVTLSALAVILYALSLAPL
ncbi:hypothetical protein CXP35_13925 [Komagataeibacter xylinus]|nr:hypothetical protein CXP35_13925 [Komagataeibacter xylinus]